MHDDHLIADAVFKCREIMHGLPTRTKMTVCYNLTLGVFRLFCISGKKKDIEQLADAFSIGMKQEIMQEDDPTYLKPRE